MISRMNENIFESPTTKPLRLLYVTARYLPCVGGTEIHTYEVVKRLASFGHDVTVLTTDLSGEQERFEQVDGARVIRVRAWPKGRDYYFAPGIFKTILTGKWDLIHCQGYHTLVAPVAMLAALQASIPFVLSFHSGGNSSKLRKAFRKWQRMMLRPLLNRAERLIAVSKFEAEFFSTQLNFSKDKFVVIPNGAYLPRPTFQPANPEIGPLILSVGRLERYKGHHRVLAALPTVMEDFPDAQLKIVGEGPYKADLLKMARDLKVTDHVSIGGLELNARKEMASLYMNADLVTLLSEYEAFPIAVLEALFLGRSVLVSDTSGLHELAEAGLVNTIPINCSVKEIATAILNQLREPLSPSQINPPSWDTCARDLLNLYQQVVHYPTASPIAVGGNA
jgi:glycosyltransferase involved in cell wall biosynthesis